MIDNVETTVPNLLGVLCSTDMPPRQHLETQQALFKQFALIIDFTLKFDDLKVIHTHAWSFLTVILSVLLYSSDSMVQPQMDQDWFLSLIHI